MVAISVLVAVHEFGHYWVARRLGFKVLRFSIGFGRPLLRWRGRDADHVEYWVSAIPLGGYVKMLDEREAPVPEAEAHRAFNRRPISHRIAVLLAGPGFNFLFAIVAYWLLFVSGVPGSRPYVENVLEGSVAAEAGLRAEDVIESVGDRSTLTWEQAVVAILDELLSDGVIDLEVSGADGDRRHVSLDVRGRESELTEPEALFDGLGIVTGPRLPAAVGAVTADSPAERAGLESGDRVMAIRGGGVTYSVEGGPPANARAETNSRDGGGQRILHWDDLVNYVRARPGETVTMTIERNGETRELPLVIGETEENGATIGIIGVTSPPGLAPEIIDRVRVEERFGVVAGLGEGAKKTWEMTALTLRMIGRMLTGDVSLRNASGPIMIAAYAGDYAQAGLNAFLSFLSLISISLGVMNLLPIPILDGGQIVQQVIEWIKGSPLSERSLVVGQQVGLALLVVLMSFVFYNDITRLFG